MNPRGRKTLAQALSVVVSAVTVLVAAPMASAGTVKTWTGASSANWSDGANWESGVAPVDTDDLVFPPGAQNTTNTNDIVGLDIGTITLSGEDYDLQGQAIKITNRIDSTQELGANRISLPLNVVNTHPTEIGVPSSFADLTLGPFEGGNLNKLGDGFLFLQGTGLDNAEVSAGLLSLDVDDPGLRIAVQDSLLIGAGSAEAVNINGGGVLAPGLFGTGARSPRLTPVCSPVRS